MNTTSDSRSVYEIVTSKLIEQLEKGVVPWQQPWTKAGFPQNLVTGRHYRNLNWLLLSMLGYERNLFLTFNQAVEMGARIKKGEKSHIVIFWKKQKPEEEDTENTKPKFILRYYLLFNISQCENIPEKYLIAMPNPDPSPIHKCAELVQFMPNRPDIVHEKHMAYYSVPDDVINMPRMETFKDNESYYAILFHELVHSTGHSSRLNRTELNEHSVKSYSMEELTAEIGSCFLLFLAGISSVNFQNSAAYIKSWIKKLQNDSKYIFHASSQAQKAVDYIRGTGSEPAESVAEEIETMDELPF